MDIPRGLTNYKKNQGILTISEDLKALTWTPLPATGPPTVSIAVENITNLQQTPDNAPKVVLRVLVKSKIEGGPPEPFQFQFVSETAPRQEANTIKDILTRLIKAQNGNGSQVRLNGDAERERAQALAKKPVEKWVDEATLLADTNLQSLVMEEDDQLRNTYRTALQMKPASISDTLFNTQFWSTRVGLLRAKSIERTQRQGAYHVLAVIKPTLGPDGKLGINLGEQHINVILKQFPLVNQLYRDNVHPATKLSEKQKIPPEKFFERFLLSRLFKRLKGERVKDDHHSEDMFDRFTEADNAALAQKIGLAPPALPEAHVPHVIDVEGNDENRGGFKGGNRPDAEMRAGGNQFTVRTINQFSRTYMKNVPQSDKAVEPDGADPVDEDTIAAVALRDLQDDTAVERLALHVKDQNRMLSTQRQQQEQSADSAAEEAVYRKQSLPEVLQDVEMDLSALGATADGAGGLDLHAEIGIDVGSDSDREDNDAAQQKRVGSKTARRAAQKQMLDGMKKRRAEVGDDGEGGVPEERPNGLTKDMAARCFLLNATTTEFLKQFWRAYLHGGADGRPASAEEMAHHVEALRRCRTNMGELADEAEAARNERMEQLKKQVQEHYRKTGKRIRPVPLKGGKEGVQALFEATLASVDVALKRHGKGS